MAEKMTITHVGSGDEFSLLRQCAQRCVDNGGEWYGPMQAAAILAEHVSEPALLADAAFIGMATPECILRLLDKAEAAHLTQPAQAVDVGAIREVIDMLNGYCEASDDSCYGTLSTSLVRDLTARITRALGNAQAEGWKELEAEARRLYNASVGDAHNLHCLAWSELSKDQQQKWINKASASPTPPQPEE